MVKKEAYRVLVVDPSVETGALTTVHLELKGYKPFYLESWNNADRILKTEGYHAVVTEWFDSFTGHPDVMKWFQEQCVPVFLLTEKDPAHLIPDWKERGFSGVFMKRHKMDLFKSLEKALEFPASHHHVSKPSVTRHVLIIDDSATTRGFVRRALEAGKKEWVIREAEDGRSALGEMTQKKVDLIITDMDMPGMDGHTFLSLIYHNPVLRQKPIIILSGGITEELVQKHAHQGNLCFLRKPSSQQEILENVERMLQE